MAARIGPVRGLIASLLVGLTPALAAAAENATARSADGREATMEHVLREAAMLQAIQSSAESAMEPPAIRLPAVVNPPGPLDPTQWRIIVDGTPAASSIPRLFLDSEPMFALKPIARELFFSTIDLGGGRVEVVSPEGQKRAVEATVINGIPALDESGIEDLFLVQAELSAAGGAVSLARAGAAPAFETYVTEKSVEQLAEELNATEVQRRALEPVEDLEFIPDAARPDLDLYWRESYTYLQPHVTPPFRTLTSSASGRVWDYQLDVQSVRKDIQGSFDHDYTRLDLVKPGFQLGAFSQGVNLDPLRFQSDGIYGVKLSTALGPVEQSRHTLMVVAGDTENSASSSAGSTKYLGHVYMLKDDFALTKALKLQGAVAYVEHEADLPELAGSTKMPRTNLVTFYGGELDLGQHLTMSSHLGLSNAEADWNPDERLGGEDWRTALAWESDRHQSEFMYEFVGDQYASFGDPSSYQDYSGWNWRHSSRLTDGWSLSGALAQYRDNVEHSPNETTTENTTVSLSSGHRLTERQYVNLNYSQFLSKPYGGASPGNSSRSSLYRADYSLPFLFDSRVLANYQYFRTTAQGAHDSFSHTTGTSLFKSYGRGSSVYVSQTMSRGFLEGGADTIDLTTSFNLNHYWVPRLSTYFTSNFTRTETDDARTTGTVGGTAGARARLFRDTDLNLEYQVSGYDLKAEERIWPRNWSILFFVSQAVRVATPPTFGKIQGRIFEDLNGNERFDTGEPAVSDAALRMDDVRDAVTDAQGAFRFARVVPGRRHVAADLSSIDPRLAMRSPKRSVEVRKQATATLEFPMVQAGFISGRVFIDDNGDRRFQETEEPVEGVAIIVLPADQSRRTGADGAFRFEGVFPGEHTVLIHHGDLPKGYELVSPDARTVAVQAGGEAAPVDFALELLVAPPGER